MQGAWAGGEVRTLESLAADALRYEEEGRGDRAILMQFKNSEFQVIHMFMPFMNAISPFLLLTNFATTVSSRCCAPAPAPTRRATPASPPRCCTSSPRHPCTCASASPTT